MIFGRWNRKKIWHENVTDCLTRLSDVTTVPWEIEKKSFSIVLVIHTSVYLHYLIRKQSVIHLPTPPGNITTLTCVKLCISGVTSHRQPRQCRGAQGPKTVKGAQSDPNYVPRLIAHSECLPGRGQKLQLRYCCELRDFFICNKTTATGNNNGQYHVVSWCRKLNTDFMLYSVHVYTVCPLHQKTSTFLFSGQLCQKLTEFNNFW